MMMVYDPEKRPSAHMLLQHPYFDDLDASRCYSRAGDYEEATNGRMSSAAPIAALAAVREEGLE